jgi:hypothetical protein
MGQARWVGWGGVGRGGAGRGGGDDLLAGWCREPRMPPPVRWARRLRGTPSQARWRGKEHEGERGIPPRRCGGRPCREAAAPGPLKKPARFAPRVPRPRDAAKKARAQLEESAGAEADLEGRLRALRQRVAAAKAEAAGARSASQAVQVREAGGRAEGGAAAGPEARQMVRSLQTDPGRRCLKAGRPLGEPRAALAPGLHPPVTAPVPGRPPPPPSQVLMAAKSSGEIPGVHGRLGDLGAIDARYDVAVSTACPALDYIVVETTSDAQVGGGGRGEGRAGGGLEGRGGEGGLAWARADRGDGAAVAAAWPGHGRLHRMRRRGGIGCGISATGSGHPGVTPERPAQLPLFPARGSPNSIALPPRPHHPTSAPCCREPARCAALRRAAAPPPGGRGDVPDPGEAAPPGGIHEREGLAAGG